MSDYAKGYIDALDKAVLLIWSERWEPPYDIENRVIKQIQDMRHQFVETTQTVDRVGVRALNDEEWTVTLDSKPIGRADYHRLPLERIAGWFRVALRQMGEATPADYADAHLAAQNNRIILDLIKERDALKAQLSESARPDRSKDE